jgi:hypothetical protein
MQRGLIRVTRPGILHLQGHLSNSVPRPISVAGFYEALQKRRLLITSLHENVCKASMFALINGSRAPAKQLREAQPMAVSTEVTGAAEDSGWIIPPRKRARYNHAVNLPPSTLSVHGDVQKPSA